MSLKFLICTTLLAFAELVFANNVLHYEDESYQLNRLPGSNVTFESISGENRRGVITSRGRDIWTLSSYGGNTWRKIAQAPTVVSFLAGDNSSGPIVSNGMDLWYMNSYAANTWRKLARPNLSPIIDVTGNNNSGAIIAGGSDQRTVAYMSCYSCNRWNQISKKAPFTISGIAGNNRQGVIIYGGGRNKEVAYLNSYSGNWATLPSHSHPIVGISGDNIYGPIIIDETGAVFKIKSYGDPKWVFISQISMAAGATLDITGNNRTGAAMIGASSATVEKTCSLIQEAIYEGYTTCHVYDGTNGPLWEEQLYVNYTNVSGPYIEGIVVEGNILNCSTCLNWSCSQGWEKPPIVGHQSTGEYSCELNQ